MVLGGAGRAERDIALRMCTRVRGFGIGKLGRMRAWSIGRPGASPGDVPQILRP